MLKRLFRKSKAATKATSAANKEQEDDTSKPVDNKEEKYILEEDKSKIRDSMSYLKSCKDFNNEEAFNTIDYLDDICWFMTRGQKYETICSTLVEFLLEAGLVQMAVKILQSATDMTRIYEYKSRSAIQMMLKGLIAIKESKVRCRIEIELVKGGIVPVLLDDLDTCDPNTDDPKQRIRMLENIDTLSDFATITPDASNTYRAANAFPILMKFVQADHTLTKIYCLRVLLQITNDEENQRLSTSGSCVALVLDLIRKALLSNDKEYTAQLKVDDSDVRQYSIPVNELEAHIRYLAKNDCNKKTIVEHGGVPIITKVLRPDYADDEKRFAIQILDESASLKNCRDVIVNHLRTNDEEALRELKEMMKSANYNSRDASNELLYKLGFVDTNEYLENVQREIDAKLDYLKSCDDYSTQEAYDAIDFIRQLCWSITPGQPREKMCSRLVNFMIEKGIGQLIVKILKSLTPVSSNSAFESRRQAHLVVNMLIFYIEKESAQKAIVEFIKCGIIRILLKDLESCDPNTRDPRQRIRITFNFFQLSNVVKADKVIPVYRACKAVDVLMRFVQAEDVMTKINSIRVLACIVNEAESQHLATTGGCISMMVEMLQKASESEEKRYIFVIKLENEDQHFNFVLLGLVKDFRNLATNDVNKEAIVRLGGVPAICTILRTDSEDDVNQVAAEALWKLSFLEGNMDTILTHLTYTDEAALQVLKEMRSSEKPQLRNASQGLLHQLGLLDIHEESPVYQPSSLATEQPRDSPPTYQEAIDGRHVMLSYNWDQQKKAIKIKDKLQAKGYNVWMDIDKMEGNILDAMANAVEKADAVLICISRSYKASPHCQTEANYTYKLQKPIIPVMMEEDYEPDGWLGAVIAMKMYIQAYSDEILEEDMLLLIRELVNKGKSRVV